MNSRYLPFYGGLYGGTNQPALYNIYNGYGNYGGWQSGGYSGYGGCSGCGGYGCCGNNIVSGYGYPWATYGPGYGSGFRHYNPFMTYSYKY